MNDETDNYFDYLKSDFRQDCCRKCRFYECGECAVLGINKSGAARACNYFETTGDENED